MHGLKKRRHWNNDKSLTVNQELHEYSQWARSVVLRKENKYPVKHTEEVLEFSLSSHSQPVFHHHH